MQNDVSQNGQAERDNVVPLVTPEEIKHQGYDDEEGTWLPITADMRDRLRRIEDGWGLTEHLRAAMIRELFDDRLYLAGGYSSKTEYCEARLNMTRRNANYLYKVATTFDLSVDGLLARREHALLGDGKTFSRENGSESEVDTGKTFSHSDDFTTVAISKLNELTRLRAEEIEEIKATKTFIDDEGNEYTFDELNGVSQRKLKQMVSAKLDPYKARLEQEEEARQKAEAERDHLKDELAALQEKIETARQLERQYGDRASLLADKKDMLRAADDIISGTGATPGLSRLIVKIGVTPEDPLELQHDVAGLLDKLQMSLDLARAEYHDVLAHLIATAD